MIDNKTIGVVIPAYNEEKQISIVVDAIPDYVDRIVVVNDASVDATKEKVTNLLQKTVKRVLPDKDADYKTKSIMYRRADEILEEINEKEKKFFPKHEVVCENNNRLVLINMAKNSGVGSAMAVGYKWMKDRKIDCVVSMDGDGQMDPSELIKLCEPVIKGEADWVKGNRLSHPAAVHIMPRRRFFGNAILTILTKIASGYWKVSDTQTGYTAISLDALNKIKLYKLYKRYGMPNDRIIRLNMADCSMKEVPVTPVYDIGEDSTMKIRKVVWPIAWLLLTSFFKRLWVKYLYKSFHPLFILYHLALILLIASVPYGIKILYYVIHGFKSNPVTVLAFVFLFISGFQSLLFAMWMDMMDNQKLYKD